MMGVFLQWIIFLATGGITFSLPNCPRNSTAYDRTAQKSYFAYLGRGYDPLGARPDDQGFQQNVFHLTGNSQEFKLPDPSTVIVTVPCEVDGNVHPIRSGNSFGVSQVMTSYQSFQSKTETSGSFGVGFLNFVGSIGAKSSVTSLLKHETVNVFEYRSYLQAEALLPVNVPEAVQSWWSADFADAVDRLHANDSTDITYEQLIDGFGTHVAIRVVLGGYIVRFADMEYCSYTKTEKSSVSAKAASDKTIMDMSAQAKFELGVSKETVDIKQKLSIRVQKSGGDDTAYKKTGDLDQYIAGTVAEKQTAVVDQGTRFLEIWKLIPASDGRRYLLKNATYAYLGPLPTESPPLKCGGGNLSRMSFFAALLLSIFVCKIL